MNVSSLFTLDAGSDSALDRVLTRLSARQDLALVAMLVATVLMLILPIPTWLADVLIATNIGLALLLMLVAVYVKSPIEFSTLPTVVLLTTAFRLSLSITTSRLVLTQGDAGEIIRAFGQFVISGNVVVGLVVYFIITIVQFVVITKGSERVAEVAARFTLDALPGKQISIDTDLRNGDIDAAEARRRRRNLEKESQLYGALDGAMKFVKGDAIASLVIIVVNLVGGITIGCLQRGLSFDGAVQTYSLLAVGDGLIAQIPALLVSLTVGTTVTRAASDGGGNLGQDILGQIVAEPRTLQIAAVVLAGLGFVPGFPTFVFLLLGAALGGAGWLLKVRQRQADAREFAIARTVSRPEPVAITVVLGEALAADKDAIAARVDALRNDIASELGVAIPRIQVSGQSKPGAEWCIEIDAVPVASGDGGTKPAALIAASARGAVIRSAEQFVGIQETQALLASIESGYGDLVREVTKVTPLPRLAEVLRRLVGEEVSLRNLRPVLECLVEWAPKEANPAQLAEHVRTALRRQICHRWADGARTLHVLLTEASLEDAVRAAAAKAGDRQMAEHPLSERLERTVRTQSDGSAFPPVVVVSGDLRRTIRAMLVRRNMLLPVIAHHEVAPEFAVQVVGTLRFGSSPSEARGGVTPLHPPLPTVPGEAAA